MREADAPGVGDESVEDRALNPANLEQEWHGYSERFEALLDDGAETELTVIAAELSPGDLSEIVRPLSVDDTAHVIRLLPRDLASDVLAEIDKRSVTALMELLTIDAIADIIEEMPSDEAADVVGELDSDQAREVLAAMEEEERDEVRELLQYPPDTAGGLMAKEFVVVDEAATCLQAVEAVRGVDEDDREELHFLYVVDDGGKLSGRIPLVEMLLQPWSTSVIEIMEQDPLRVGVELDQEQVAQYVRTHDLVTLPVVDGEGVMLGVISTDDVLDVIEDEATEDISRLAGTSEILGETSPIKVARARLPWLMGALLGQVGCILLMQHYEASIQATVALAFFIPAIMAMGGNTGIQTSSVVVRGLATGEVNVYHIGRYLLKELATALINGTLVAAALYAVAALVVGDPALAMVLTISMLSVIVFAAMVGTAIPFMLHRLGIDPAIATGPFITTSNDLVAILIYLSTASLLIQ